MRKSRNSWLPLGLAVLALVVVGLVGRGAGVVEAEDDPRDDNFKFSSDGYTVLEGATLTVTVLKVVDGEPDAHTVTVTATDGVGVGGAVDGVHYDFPGSGMAVGLFLGAGNSQATFNIPTIVNGVPGPDVTFNLTISNVSESGGTVVPFDITVTIIDDESAPPAITSLNPSSGSINGGNVVQINGSGFTGVDCTGGVTGVEFGPGNDALCTVVSDIRIDATAPAHAAGQVDVSVTHPTNGTNTNTSADNYTFVTPGAPSVSSVNPGSGVIGQIVIISGTNFAGVDCSGPGVGVDFGTVDATSCSVNGAGTQITAVAPTPIVMTRPHPVDVRVTVEALTSPNTAADDFIYSDISITGVSPNSGPAGIAVTISGTGFSGAPADVDVKFGTVEANVVTVNPTSIVATVPAPTSGLPLVNVSVTIGLSTSANTDDDDFQYVDVVVTNVSPNTGPQGTVVTITGSGFTATPTVQFGTQTATVNTFTPTSITAIAPTNPPGKVDVLVTVGTDTSANTAADDFTYTAGGVSVTALDPNKGPTVGGNTVKVTGTGFLAGATITVSFGGTAGTNVTRISDTELTVVAPAHAAGIVSVRVTVNGALSPDGAPDDYTFAEVPVIISIAPAEGQAGATTIVTILGLNFVEGSVVKFGDIEAVRTIHSPTEIRAVAPSTAPPGTVDVTVTNAAGTSAKGPHTLFKFLGSGGVPAITNLSPKFAPLNTSGVEVTITGLNFSTPATVKFGTLDATGVQVLSSTEIKAIAPLRATAGVVEVTVTTPVGTSATGGTANDFTYGMAPPAGTTTYSLFVRFTLITWGGTNNMPVGDALRGQESPDNNATNNVLSIVTAVYYWSQDGTGCPTSAACWLAYFPSGVGIPGANNLLAMVFGRAYWVAVLSNVNWTVISGQ